MKDTYDYIVVGGGTAGCVLASRLSQDDAAQVLLLEAGDPEPPEEAAVPPAWPTLQGTRADWNDIPDVWASAPVAWPRGRGLGGSSNINGMIFIRGHRSSYDWWTETAAHGWDFDALLPYFKCSETVVSGRGDHRGSGGPMKVAPASEPSPVVISSIEAAVESGHLRAADIGGGLEEGVGLADLTIVDGRRQTAADAYLRPVLGRPNLDVVTGAHVHRLVLSAGRCSGVEFAKDGQSKTAGCSGEVILAAGTVGSAQLLLLSGIGPASQLREVGVDVAVDLPGVGANLHDHALSGVTYTSSRPVPPSVNNHGEAVGLLRSGQGELNGPDLQILLVACPYFHPALSGPGPDEGYTIAVSLMSPHSRGSLRLASADPTAAPLIDSGYLNSDRDVDALMAGLDTVREIGSAPSLKAWRGKEAIPGDAVPLRSYLRDNLMPYFHYVGTCRIGTDSMAVVDDTLRVRGITGLRVADASVIPSIPSANTNATVCAIAERAAALISEHDS
jgi:choline dehydrogenase